MIRAALASFAALILAPIAAAQVTVKGEWISLGDVAPVTGEAADILIGPAPPPGEKLALDPAFLASVAKRSGIILALPLDQPIWVTRAGGTAPAAKQANVARPANPAPSIGAQASTPTEILVLVRDVGRGHRIGEADVDWAEPTSPRAPHNNLTDIDLVLGMEARRPLRAGQPILASDIKTPALIRKGQSVKLVYSSPGLKLTVDGLAQGEAAKGESVRVLNTFSKRTIDAVAEAEGEARVVAR
jgi:flagella basal body P-ring formation protein FlgA